MITIAISLIAVVLFVTGTPIVLVIALWVAGTSYFVVDFPLTNVALASVDSLKSYAFLAVPLFVATGDFLTAGGVSQRLTSFARTSVSFVPGATASSAAAASGLFAAVSGSNAATAATMGRLLGPDLVRTGVPRGLAASVIAASGSLGIIIPPSTLFIVYGVTMNVSPVDLNLAGLVPGLICMVFLLAWVSYLTRKIEPSKGLSAFSIREVLRAGVKAYLGVIAVAIIFCGLYFGWFSSTEAAGVAALYCLMAGLFVTRQIRWKELPAVMRQSASLMGIIGPLVVFSIQFQQILGVMGTIDPVQDWLIGVGNNVSPLLAMALMMLLILIVGSLTESVAVVLVLGPVLAPVANAIGIDPIHWGVVFVFGTSIGFVTPPYGLNLFIVSSVMSVPYEDVVRHIWRMLLPLIGAWIVVAALPTFT